jgi:hypothetical protein
VREERLDDTPDATAAPFGGAPQAAFARQRRAMSTITNELAGLDLAPKKKVGVRVRLAYRVSQSRT